VTVSALIEGNGVTLKAIERADLERVRLWRNDPDISQCMVSQALISEKQQLSWFDTISDDKCQQHYVIEFKSEPIGVINMKSVCGASLNRESLHSCRQIEMGMYIHDERYRGNFLAFCPAVTLNDYCFDQLSCEKLMARVLLGNEAAIRFNTALGYQVTSEKSDATDAQQQGLITMTLSKDNYQVHSEKIRRLIRY